MKIMMRKLYKKTLPLMMLAAFTASAQAQEDLVKTTLLSVGLKGAIDGLYFKNGGSAEELKATMTGLGTGIDYEGPAVVNFYDSPEAMIPKEDGKTPVPLARVKLPEGEDKVLVIIAPPPKGKKGPAMRAYGISTDKFKAGDYRFFNFSKQNVAVILGKKKIGLSPGSVESVSSAAWKKEIIDLPVKLGSKPKEGDVKLVYSSVWGHQPRQRNMIMIFEGGSKAKPLEVRRYSDVPGVKIGRNEEGGEP